MSVRSIPEVELFLAATLPFYYIRLFRAAAVVTLTVVDLPGSSSLLTGPARLRRGYYRIPIYVYL